MCISKFELMENLLKPCNPACSCFHSLVFSLSTVSNNCFLLLASPRNEVPTNEKTVSRSGPPIWCECCDVGTDEASISRSSVTSVIGVEKWASSACFGHALAHQKWDRWVGLSWLGGLAGKLPVFSLFFFKSCIYIYICFKSILNHVNIF